MKQIKRRYMVAAALAVAGLVGLQTAQAGVITAADISNGSGAFTTTDTLVTLTPYAEGLVAGTFESNGNSLFGVAGGIGTNVIGDQDGNPATTADREAIGIALDTTVGLSQFSFAWARAYGDVANDGIVISGFLSDPGVSASGGGWVLGNGARYNAADNAVYISWYNWSGTPTVIDLANPAASAGQTLTLSVNDFTQAGPRFSVNTLGYDAIPEPATIGMVAVFGGGILFMRRRFKI